MRSQEKRPGAPLRGRCDSLFVETDVRYATDVRLMWSALRCLIRETGRAAAENEVAGMLQWKRWMRSAQALLHKVRSTRRARPEPINLSLLTPSSLLSVFAVPFLHGLDGDDGMRQELHAFRRGRNTRFYIPPAQIRTWSLNHPAPTSSV